MEDRRSRIAVMRRRVFLALLWSLSSILGTVCADTLPANVVVIPVLGARSVALHPSKSILYIGLAGRTNGMSLTTFALDKDGRPIPESRRDHADGIVEGGSVPAGSEYSVAGIALNPVQLEIYLSALPVRMPLFRADTNASLLVALALDEDGLPREKIRGIKSHQRKFPIWHMACDPLGRYLYLGEYRGLMGFWFVGGTEPTPAIKTQPLPTPRRALPRPPRVQKAVGESQVAPPLKLADWVYVADWDRCYGSDQQTRKMVFCFNQDGRSCEFAQPISTQSKYTCTPQVSVRHRKLYVPNAQGSRMAVYQLTREGRLTSLPRYVSVDSVHLSCVDEANDRFYVVTAKEALSIYSLDAEGYPAAEPKRFDLNAGRVNGLTLGKSGTLYLACATPPGGTL